MACVNTSAAHRMADRLLASRDGILEYMMMHIDGEKKDGEKKRTN
jgi:hypothetical protein